MLLASESRANSVNRAADEVLGGNPHVGEEDVVELARSGHLAHGPVFDSGRRLLGWPSPTWKLYAPHVIARVALLSTVTSVGATGAAIGGAPTHALDPEW